MILVITIIMITVQSTPTIAPIMAALLLLSQDSQAVVHNYKNNVCKNVSLHIKYVCNYVPSITY